MPADRQRTADTGPKPHVPCLAPLFDQAIADTGDAHLLAGRRGRRGGKQMAGEPVVGRGLLLRDALHAGPPHRSDRRRRGEQREQHERRVNRHQQRDGHAEPHDPPAGRKHRHVHVVEHEHLIAQHRQPVEVVRALLMGNRRHRRLQPRDVGLERDRDSVAEPPLDARAHRHQTPRRRGGHAERNGGDAHEAGVVLQDALVRSDLNQNAISESGNAESSDSTNATSIRSRLVAVAQLAQPPHGR